MRSAHTSVTEESSLLANRSSDSSEPVYNGLKAIEPAYRSSIRFPEPDGSVVTLEDELKPSTSFGMFKLVFEILFHEDYDFILAAMGYIGIWTSICVVGLQYMHAREAEFDLDNPDDQNTWTVWIGCIQKGGDPVKLIGSLFVFSLVFRFGVCYNRWWGGRELWGKIMSISLGLSITVNRSIADSELAEKFNRYIVVFCYTCKALLKHQRFGHEDSGRTGDAEDLVQRGFLTEEELKEIKANPCWEPHFCLDMMLEILHEAFLTEGSFFLHKANQQGSHYGQFNGDIKTLNNLVGDMISIQSADLPVAYDGIHLFAFFMYFTLSPIIWSSQMFWLAVPMSLSASFVALSVLILGTQLCDPFGDDKVDIRVDRLCKMVEYQIRAMEVRRKKGTVKGLVSLNRKASSENLKDKNVPAVPVPKTKSTPFGW